MPNTPSHIAGTRMLPPTSVPTPSGLPRIATSAPSPPLDPPAVHAMLCGFSVRPKTQLCESRAVSVWGILVLQCSTAPASRRSCVSSDGFVAGLKDRAVNPMDESSPGIWKVSLREIGRPCSGPTGLPWWARWASRVAARSRAASKLISVMQLVNCCAMAARCQMVSKSPADANHVCIPCRMPLSHPRSLTVLIAAPRAMP